MRTVFIIACAGAYLLAPPQAAAAEAKKPNVLIVMTDDQGLGDFSYTGNPVLKTPNLDAFAKQSVRLTDFHVCPMCSPTRGQLLTGLSALRNGATSVTAGRTFTRPGLPTLPEAFAKAGYKTGIFGKWHLGDSYPHRPIDRGFQECIYHLGWGQLHSTPEFDWPLIDGRYFHNGVEKRYKGHCTDFWFDSAMAWMKERKAKSEPFLCYLPTNAPHAPHIDLEDYIKPYQGKGPAGFFGMIAHIDRRFGDLEKFLADEKLKDDTIVIFMTDNGGTSGVNTFNAGLRGRKTQYYDGGHRVPCWIRWPNGELGKPRDIQTPTQNTDLFPTLCELCSVPQPKWDAKDEPYRGTTLVPLLKGAPRRIADRKFVVQYGQIPKKFEACVIWGKWRLVKGEELYDTGADREQKTDVAAKRPEIVKAMRDYYESWWKGLEPTLNDFVPISLGAKQQPVVELNSGDWEGIYADNSGFVREAVGGPTGGHWHLLVEQAGEYEFTLRRWPEQTKAALGDKYEPSAKSPSNRPKGKQVTKGFPTIAVAKIDIAGVKGEVKADPKATSATITVKLPEGKTKLKAWFSDADGKDLCGAFFVTVKKVGAERPTKMHFPGKEWEVVKPEAEGLDAKKLADAVAYLEKHAGRDGVKELVLVRRGRIVWHGDNIDKVHGIWSCTKSFTSTTLGLLIDDKKCTLDTKAATIIPALKEQYPNVTLRHFTTMTSGYTAAGDDKPPGSYLHGPSSTPFVPAKPLFAPGEKYAYWDSAMNEFGLVLTEIAGESLDALLKRRIMDPIGADAEKWKWGERKGVANKKVNSGSGNAGGHVQISAREMARFGHLFLNEGNWDGKQLLGKEWVRHATVVQVKASVPDGFPASKIAGSGCYGFNWWVNGTKSDGKRKWPNAPARTFAAMGHNNNLCIVIPEWQMVVVRLGLDQSDRKIDDEAISEFLKRVGAAITD